MIDRVRSIVAAVVLLAALLPAAARAATVADTAGDGLEYSAASGERNDVIIRHSGSLADGVWHVRDRGAPLRADGGCTTGGPHTVVCRQAAPACDLSGAPLPGGHCLIGSVALGDRDDRASVAGVQQVFGGDGDDVVKVTDGTDTWLYGEGGNDRLVGGAGDDTLNGGRGRDDLWGGGGTDLADYFDRRGPGVRVTLDGKANDGAPGEHDDVRTEDVNSSGGDDVLVGNGNPNHLIGWGGNDVLLGRGGDDVLEDFDGWKRIGCGAGFDTAEVLGPLRTPATCEHATTETDGTGLTPSIIRVAPAGHAVDVTVDAEQGSEAFNGDSLSGSVRISGAGVHGAARFEALEPAMPETFTIELTCDGAARNRQARLTASTTELGYSRQDVLRQAVDVHCGTTRG